MSAPEDLRSPPVAGEAETVTEGFRAWPMNADERQCFDRGMEQWRASLKRPDMAEEDRVKGALLAYVSQAYALRLLPTSADMSASDEEPAAEVVEAHPTPAEASAQLREYARRQRHLHGTCPPGDNIFEDAANLIERLALIPTSAARDRGEALTDILDEYGAPGFGSFSEDEEEHFFTVIERIKAFGERYAAISRELGEARDKLLTHPTSAATPAVPDAAPSASGAARDVLAERQRQVEAEGWTAEHDDAHTDSEIAKAAACYAVGRMIVEGGPTHFDNISRLWPWDPSWWKPTDRRRNLVKAGALILAEIERLDRLPSVGRD